MPKKSKPEATDELSCALCTELHGLTVDEFKRHRTLAHGDKDPGHLKMQLIMHLDGIDFFANSYEIIDADKNVVGHRYTNNPRSKRNKEMWR